MYKPCCRFFAFFLALLLLCAFTAAAGADQTENTEEPGMKFVIASDLHYIAPALTDHGAYFEQLVHNSDGKLMDYSEELVDAFLQEIITEKPDALLLSGDLTFNGAEESHRALAEKLARVEAAGIPVLVIPGNHDTNNYNAARFTGDTFQRVHSATAEEFRAIYEPFGIGQAISRAPDTFSYLAPLGSNCWALMLDTNTVNENVVTEKTMNWVRTALQEAQARGVKVIAVSHQNLLAHHALFAYGYQIENAARLQALYEEYGVLVNLSGHMHIQSRKTSGITEILTSALAITPSHYGVVYVNGEEWDYELRSTDVSAWAQAKGLTDENLLDFARYSKDFFDDCDRRMISRQMMGRGLTEPELRLLVDSFAEINRRFFTGEEIHAEEFEEGLDLWKQQETDFTQIYLLSLVQ